MFKNILLIFLIIITGYSYYWLDKTEQLDDFLTSAKKDVSIVENLIGDNITSVKDESNSGDKWIEYTNTKYKFSMQYPSNWDIFESVNLQNERAIHKIYIREKEDNLNQGELIISVFANEDVVSVNEWWNEWLRDEDKKKEICVEKYGSVAPCLYLRDRVESETEVEIAETLGFAINLFQFNSEKKCQYTASDVHIFGFCHEDNSAGDTVFENKSEIYEQIVGSIKFLSQ